MKNVCSFAFCVFSFFTASSQNTGIGTATPVQTLDVNGAIKVSGSTNNQPGSIRYNSGTFEGGNGTTWKSLEGLPSKAIIIAQTPDTSAIKAAGFSVLRQMDLWDTITIPVSTNYPGSWTNGFPLSSSTVTPASTSCGEAVMYNNNYIYYGLDGFLYDYDIAGQKWIKLPNVCPLGERNACGTTLVGDEIFITGGWKFAASTITMYNGGAKYNMLTNNWTTIANIPVTSAYHATAAIGTDIYLLDGASSFTSTFNFGTKMYKYNTVSNTWSADLTTGTTPPYVGAGSLASYNNKLLWNYTNLVIFSFDPVTQVNTNLTPSISPTAVTFDGGFRLTLGTNKVYIDGSIADTTAVTSTPGTYIPAQYEVDLVNGTYTQLNVCQLPAQLLNQYKYNPADNKIYGLGYVGTESYIFNTAGAQQCDLSIHRRGYWYYMKKN